MRKIIVTSFVSLDGVLQAPGGPQEDPTNGFKWGGWTFPLGDDATNEAMGSIMSQPFDLLLGRKTYEIFAAYWPYKKNHPIADKFNSLHKFVVSSQQIDLSWEGSTLITGNVVAGLKKLKQQEGPDLLLHGSSVLVQTLLEHGLADILHVWTYPVTFGKGKRLFGEGTQPVSWKLTDSKITSKGVILASYEPTGEIKTGTFELEGEKPSEAELARRKKLAAES